MKPNQPHIRGKTRSRSHSATRAQPRRAQPATGTRSHAHTPLSNTPNHTLNHMLIRTPTKSTSTTPPRPAQLTHLRSRSTRSTLNHPHMHKTTSRQLHTRTRSTTRRTQHTQPHTLSHTPNHQPRSTLDHSPNQPHAPPNHTLNHTLNPKFSHTALSHSLSHIASFLERIFPVSISATCSATLHLPILVRMLCGGDDIEYRRLRGGQPAAPLQSGGGVAPPPSPSPSAYASRKRSPASVHTPLHPVQIGYILAQWHLRTHQQGEKPKEREIARNYEAHLIQFEEFAGEGAVAFAFFWNHWHAYVGQRRCAPGAYPAANGPSATANRWKRRSTSSEAQSRVFLASGPVVAVPMSSGGVGAYVRAEVARCRCSGFCASCHRGRGKWCVAVLSIRASGEGASPFTCAACYSHYHAACINDGPSAL